MPPATTHDLASLLHTHFGYSAFRPLQEEVINTVISGNDALVVMPTGSGKSLCFQLPALCREGTTLVLSPLISLMKDQVDGLRADGIAAAFLNSSQTAPEQEAVKNAALYGDIKLLYIAPERLSMSGFHEFLRAANVNLLAIDEAHCISEWGHEFRPDYRNLTTLREAFPDIPCIALTATATPKVREDIREQLHLTDAPLFLSSFNRENLTYHVYPKHRSLERLLLTLRTPQRLPAIAYCFSRKNTEILAEDLRAEGFTCLPYHAGLDPAIRRQTQEKFMRDQVQIVTATIAFGMGIDKPDVRTVVHMDLPKNIEGYYQETGRAGRDGLQSDCILFYSYGDRFKQEFFIEEMEDPIQKMMAKQKLDQMIRFAELRTCRRHYLLQYFGEHPDFTTCNSCDRCLTKEEMFDATVIAQQILCAVLKTGQRFGTAHVCDVLRGKNTERIRSLQHGTLSVYGIVKDFDDHQLREIVGSLIDVKLLTKTEGQYPTLVVTEAGQAFLLNRTTLHLPKLEETLKVAKKAKDDDGLAFNAELFEELRALRRGIAEEQGVAAYIVFGDRSLREMAAYFPQKPESFQQIYGVSERKLELYGEQFLTVIQAFASLHGLTEKDFPADRNVQKKPRERAIRREGSTYEETRQLILQKLPLEEIARQRDLKPGTIIQHIEALVLAGAEIDFDYLKPPAIAFEKISQSFAMHGLEALSPIFGQCNAAYSFDLIRLVRAFLWKAEKKAHDPAL